MSSHFYDVPILFNETKLSNELKRHFNIQTVTFWMEGHVNPDDWETMMDACDITKWNPIAPNGFFLIDIHFSEDDAYALFARNKREVEVA